MIRSVQYQLLEGLMEIGEQHVLLVKRLSSHLRRVLKHIPSGKNNAGIADVIGVNEQSVATSMTRIYTLLEVPRAIKSRNERRILAGRMYERFAQLYEVNNHGDIVDRAEIEIYSQSKPVPKQPVVAVESPHTNGHDKAVEKAPVPPVATRPVGVSGYGVGLTIHVPEPHTVTGMSVIVLGSDGCGEKLQDLLAQGYLPEIVNDFQSLSGTRSITKIVLIKRK